MVAAEHQKIAHINSMYARSFLCFYQEVTYAQAIQELLSVLAAADADLSFIRRLPPVSSGLLASWCIVHAMQAPLMRLLRDRTATQLPPSEAWFSVEQRLVEQLVFNQHNVEPGFNAWQWEVVERVLPPRIRPQGLAACSNRCDSSCACCDVISPS